MLGKLIKHEFKATYKTFVLLFLSLFALSILTRISLVLPSDNRLYEIFAGLLLFAYVMMMIFIALLTYVLIINRFYRNVFKDEGYLTHTLPVKKSRIIISKTIVGVVWEIATLFAMAISLFIFFVGRDEFIQFLKDVNHVISAIGKYPSILIIVFLSIIALIAQAVVTILVTYAAIALGQIFRKHKVAGAVLFYFILNYAMSFVIGALSVLIPNNIDDILGINFDVEINSAKQLADRGIPIVSCVLILMILVLVISGVIYYGITNHMLCKKTNLE